MTDSASIESPDDSPLLAAAVEGLRATEEAIAALEAHKTAQLATAMRVALKRMEGKHPTQRTREMELRSIAAEIGAAVRWSDRMAQRRMTDALDLVEHFPATVDALASGRNRSDEHTSELQP